jgi:hypothetical protein
MTATPVIPGRAYQVSGFSLNMTVLAKHPVDAIVIAIELLIEQGVAN